MAGGPTTAAMAAAAVGAGGFGGIAGAYLTAPQLADTFREALRLLGQAPGSETRAPLVLNLFVPPRTPPPPPSESAMKAALAYQARLEGELRASVSTTLDLPEHGTAPEVRGAALSARSGAVAVAAAFESNVEAILELRPAAFSFVFGVPDDGILRAMRRAGIALVGTATSVEEAALLAEAGVDGIVAQGVEAGGHRGIFSVPTSAEEAASQLYDDGDGHNSRTLGAQQLVASIRRELGPSADGRPTVVAAGGIARPDDVARMREAGADAVQLGTALLLSQESGISAPYAAALRAAQRGGRDDPGAPVFTRAFSGRWAKGLPNLVTRAAENSEASPLLTFPMQNDLTSSMRKAATAAGTHEYISLWCGDAVAASAGWDGQTVDAIFSAMAAELQ